MTHRKTGQNHLKPEELVYNTLKTGVHHVYNSSKSNDLANEKASISRLYTELQKKPISHFSSQLWKKKFRNANIFYTIFLNNRFCIK